MLLHLYSRTLYRPLSRFMHRFGLHHTRRIGPMEDGAVIHKCEWCGVSRVDHTMESIRRKMAADRDAVPSFELSKEDTDGDR